MNDHMGRKDADGDRLGEALRAALPAARPSLPPGLKADLLRLARARDAELSRPWWAGLSEALSPRSWAYGAGAAFAAAAVLLALRAALPTGETPLARAPEPGPELIADAGPEMGVTTLAELWSEDDGGDHDRL